MSTQRAQPTQSAHLSAQPTKPSTDSKSKRVATPESTQHKRIKLDLEQAPKEEQDIKPIKFDLDQGQTPTKEEQEEQEEEEEEETKVRYALLRLGTGQQGKTYPLSCEKEGQLQVEGGNTIGSRSWVEDTNNNSHVCVDDVLVSLVHTRIRWISMLALNHHELLICDGGPDGKPSRSGTLVNGVPISSATFQQLCLDDIITLGGSSSGGGGGGGGGGSEASTNESGLSSPPLSSPRFQLIDLEEYEDYEAAKTICSDLMEIFRMSKTSLRLSNDDARDQEHLQMYHQLMQAADMRC